MDNERALRVLSHEVIACRKCPRLVAYRERVAQEKRRAFREWTYWGKPVPGFGDPQARLLIVGLAPAAHGANRTGRMFTGDRSGDFLFTALHKAGFANQAVSHNRDDGLRLENAYVTAAVRCAPPGNKPLPSETAHCRDYFEREFDLLQPRAILALGKFGWDACLRLMRRRGVIESASEYRFSHGAEYQLPGEAPRLFGVYHPSQQNTQTGLLTPAMYAGVLRRIRQFLATSAKR